MIPIQLKLKNFMSYGDKVPPISFSSFHLACLTGDNGNGKSALLDAMTWAIWGQARGVDKNGAGMDDLVRLGQSEMEVEFTFQLEKDIYRIIRKRDKKRGLSLLEFQLKDEKIFRVISGNKISESQEKINQVLKMDYETFINSAFVLQGKADTFTQQKPNDRKRILGEILGLTYYEQLEQKARKKALYYEHIIASIDQQLNYLTEETKDKEELKKQLEIVKQKANLSKEKIKAKEMEYQSLQEAKQDYDESIAKANQLKIRIEQDLIEIKEIDNKIESTKTKISQGDTLLIQETDITQGFQELTSKLKLKEDYLKKQSLYFEFKEKRDRLEAEINKELGMLKLKLENLKNQSSELELVTKDEYEKEERLVGLRNEFLELEKLMNVRENKEKILRDLTSEIKITEAKIADLENKVKELRLNYQTLMKAPKCPFCSTDLKDEENKKKVLKNIETEGKDIANKLNMLIGNKGSFLHKESLLKNEILNLDYTIKQKENLSREIALIERDLKQINDAKAKLSKLQEDEKRIRLLLNSQQFMVKEKNELEKYKKEIENLDFSKEALSKLNNEIEKLKVYNDKMNQLNLVKVSLRELRANLIYYEDTKMKKVKNIDDDKSFLQVLLKRAQELKEIPIEINKLLISLEDLKEEVSKLELEQGAIEEKYNRCLAYENEKNIKLKEKFEYLKEKNYFIELVQAFGKKGIQAIIIENAIPELQEEANLLLNRMTDGRLNVTLITQKGNKKGNVVETLDIQISDELGTRKYEMYSGGEVFRVNFALRIALSKLLAKRAGARLETLIIDEGFGTQDGKGKERLIELINSIQEDFSKILVITHIRELKDAFPVHLEIKKEKEGSTVTII